MILKKALINFAMMQTVLFASSLSFGVQFASDSGILGAAAVFWIFGFFLSLLPSIAASLVFAYFSK